MTEAARRRAEACFAVARSATIAGERAAAIDRGTAIAARAGLPLDDFDIPGRARTRKPPPDARLFDGGPFGGFTYVEANDMGEFFDAMADLMRRSATASRRPDPMDVRAERARRAARKCGPCAGSGFASGRVNHGRLCPFCSGQGEAA